MQKIDRTRIVKSGANLLTKYSSSSITKSEIAKEAGVSAPVINNHFTDEELWREIAVNLPSHFKNHVKERERRCKRSKISVIWI